MWGALFVMVAVTGTAGFIGYHVARTLLERGEGVVGFDNFNDYYDPALKEARNRELEKFAGFRCIRGELSDLEAVGSLFKGDHPRCVIHLGAQAGVRYSIDHPRAYVDSNVVGFLNILECCRAGKIEHLVYGSSSSVYGTNRKMPYSVHDGADHPVSLYAATKKSNELMAHVYSHLFGLPTTGLRFFTVYGPWGRPDMAYFRFTTQILSGEPIDVYNNGDMLRDFTYVDDVVAALLAAAEKPPKPNPDWDSMKSEPSTAAAPYRVFNIGAHRPIPLMSMIEALEECFGKKAEKRFLPMQSGEVMETFADVSDLENLVGFSPKVPLAEGLARFAKWYRDYYGV